MNDNANAFAALAVRLKLRLQSWSDSLVGYQ